MQALARTAPDVWQATLDDGTACEAPTVFLATGKHDLRGYARPEDPQRWVAFKMYFRLAPAQAAELARASELMLYPGGYGGIQPVEGGIANLCCVVQQRYLARVGHRWENFLAKMQQDCPHLAMRLAGAEPLLDKPIAITHIPYGYIRRTTEDGLYCIGDQAAVIPSFTGDGISIALHTARCAVAAYLAAEPAPLFQAKLRIRTAGPDAPCRVRRRWLEQLLRARCIAVLPQGLARRDARDSKTDTRRPARRCCSHAVAGLKSSHAKQLSVVRTHHRRNAMKSFAVFALAAALAPAALAQHQTFVVNPDASEVKMTLKTTHELVNGAFHVQSGSIEFDRSTAKMRGFGGRPRRQRQDRQ